MTRRLLSAGAALSALFVSGHAAANDAYDDDEEEVQPEQHEASETAEKDPSGAPLESGGLAAPDALPETGDDRTEIEKDLEKADQKDAGRGLQFVFLSGELGFQTVGLTTFNNSGLVPEGETATGSGLTYGGGLGFRLLYFTLGARFRNASLGAFDHWSLLAEGALRVPLGKLEPYALLGGGFAAVPRLAGAEAAGGFDLRLGVGLDFYPSDSFSIGAQIGGDMLFLSDSSSSALGGAMTTTGLVGLHF